MPEIYDKTLAKLPFSQLPTRKTQKSTGAQLRFPSTQHKSQALPLHRGFECLEQSETCGLISPTVIARVTAEAGKEKGRRDLPELISHRSLARSPERRGEDAAAPRLRESRRLPSPEAAALAEDSGGAVVPLFTGAQGGDPKVPKQTLLLQFHGL